MHPKIVSTQKTSEFISFGKWIETYREVTKPLVEQATIFQVQGSTEFISHPLRTWYLSSIILFLIDINAATRKTPTNQKQWKIHSIKKNAETWSAELNFTKGFCKLTFIVNTLWRKKTVWTSNQIKKVQNHYKKKKHFQKRQSYSTKSFWGEGQKVAH